MFNRQEKQTNTHKKPTMSVKYRNTSFLIQHNKYYIDCYLI